MKKKILAIGLVVLLATLTGCGMPAKTPMEERYVGRYELTELSGSKYLSVETYEYSYLELTADGGYRIENKTVEGAVTSQEGAAFVEGDSLILYTDLGYFRVSKETYEIGENKISLKNVKATEDGEIIYLTFVFEKAV